MDDPRDQDEARDQDLADPLVLVVHIDHGEGSCKQLHLWSYDPGWADACLCEGNFILPERQLVPVFGEAVVADRVK